MTNLNLPDASDYPGPNIETGINDALAALDKGWRADLTLDMSGGSASPTVDQARETMLFRCANVGTAGGTLNYPALEKPFIVEVPAGASQAVDIVKGSTTISQAVGTFRWYRSGPGANDLFSPEIGGGALQSAVGTDFLGVIVGIDNLFWNSITGNTAAEYFEWHREFFNNVPGSFDPSTNPQRLTIPAGVSKVNFFLCCAYDSVVFGERIETLITKNGAAFPGELIRVDSANSERMVLSFESGPVDVSATDYFEVINYVARAGTFTIRDDATLFGYEVIGGELFEGAYNAVPLDILMPFFSGVPGTTTVIHKQVVTQSGTFPDAFAGSQAAVGTNPSGTTTFDIDLNGTTVGNLAFDTSGNPTFTTTTVGAVSVSPGDRIEIVTQGAVNAIADISISLKGFVG